MTKKLALAAAAFLMIGTGPAHAASIIWDYSPDALGLSAPTSVSSMKHRAKIFLPPQLFHSRSR